MAVPGDVLAAVDKGLDGSVERLFELLRIPSISTDPAHKADCRKAGAWLVETLKGLGFEASLRDTTGHPMVVAHGGSPVSDRSPHVLFYGHYDVQPADPLEKWLTPPFDPVRRKDSDGAERIYARGSSDDKGQLLTFIEASRAWIAETGKFPIKVTFLLEGEEESGSPSLLPFLRANAEELKADVALVCDTGMWDAKTPAITTRLRGLVHEEVTITGPRIDLHSGAFGGPAINPIRVLSKIVADLHDKRGRVTIPGFYEGVGEPPKATKAQWQGLKFSEKRFLGEVGLKIPAGEKGRSVLEQIWSRPTAEVNGIYGGYTGVGTKTVLPSQATAKISFRLVGKQKPEAVRRAFRKFVKERLPADCKAHFAPEGGASPAIEIPETSEWVAKASQALKDEFRRDPVLIGSGGSIPIVRSFKDVLGMDSLLVGFALNDDAIHSPNEKYDLSSFHKGIRSWARIIGEFAEQTN